MPATSERKRYVVAGTGGRALYMFVKPLLNGFPQYCELVGLFDHNPLRMKATTDHIGVALPSYTDFDRMLAETKPDAVVVATKDATHAEFIIRALAAGKRVIAEKPVATDAKQLSEIMRAAERYKSIGASCLVTHNMRYGNSITAMKRLLDEGAIGTIKSVNFHENLNRSHGADYFRRWHRRKENSGGLLIHKASHHFDALNWLIGSIPMELAAQGGLMMYGAAGPFRNDRCLGCPHASKCDFYVDFWKNDLTRQMYKDAEASDGYVRDGCVFDLSIDIEDQASVFYTYANGVQVTYSLTAFATYEGWHIQFEGTKGRLELKEMQATPFASGESMAHGLSTVLGESLLHFDAKTGQVRTIPIASGEGTHGGADEALHQDFFNRPFDAPLTNRMAPLDQAVQAVLIGHAANVSMANGSKKVRVQELLTGAAKA
ncbi:MAG: Gfo/Idh/MocA family oxidoreductase [Planctomycetes bacterium]|nr:Gfo/Idh/MocA family oxidoreductase [Planctomycetota bacterium]